MYLFDNHSDPAFRYESLARSVFDNCGKYGDPWGYAAQDQYNAFVPSPTLEGKRALSTVLCKMIYDQRDTEFVNELRELENAVWVSETQEQIIEIIDTAIEAGRQLGYA